MVDRNGKTIKNEMEDLPEEAALVTEVAGRDPRKASAPDKHTANAAKETTRALNMVPLRMESNTGV